MTWELTFASTMCIFPIRATTGFANPDNNLSHTERLDVGNSARSNSGHWLGALDAASRPFYGCCIVSMSPRRELFHWAVAPGTTQNGEYYDIRQDLTLDSVRRSMAVIPQDTVLFHESIGYNINYGNWDATWDEVVEAAKKAKIHDTIMNKFPQGYEYGGGRTWFETVWW